jgi:two-component system response regulator GlrR
MGYWVNMPQMTTRNIQTIVLIDDEVKLTKAWGQVLTQKGFNVREFQNGKRALECLARERADLVITDIYMDEMDGMEVLKALKESYPKIKTIVMSGGSQVVDLDCLTVAKMIGADRALSKPVELKALLNTISELDAELGEVRPRQGPLKSMATLKNPPDPQHRG